MYSINTLSEKQARPPVVNLWINVANLADTLTLTLLQGAVTGMVIASMQKRNDRQVNQYSMLR